jgi:hypothetical protein
MGYGNSPNLMALYHRQMRNKADEKENNQEAPADNEDAEAKGGKPEPEKREAGGLIPVRVQARSFTTLLG